MSNVDLTQIKLKTIKILNITYINIECKYSSTDLGFLELIYVPLNPTTSTMSSVYCVYVCEYMDAELPGRGGGILG